MVRPLAKIGAALLMALSLTVARLEAGRLTRQIQTQQRSNAADVRELGYTVSMQQRSIAELAGITNMLSKELGSRNKTNVAYAVFDGLKNLRTAKQVRALRGSLSGHAGQAAGVLAAPVAANPGAAEVTP